MWGGYLHSAHLQRVKIALNEPDVQVSEAGRLAEVTVPYTEAFQYNERDGWYPWRGSRLYYDTTHWVTGIQDGPDGEPWYQITSELSKGEKYFAPAKHLRMITAEEIAPLSPDVPPEQKRIEVSLAEQTLRAFEGDRLVLETKISSGIPNGRLSKDELPTATPKGKFRIYAKQPSKHMGSITGNPDAEANGEFQPARRALDQLLQESGWSRLPRHLLAQQLRPADEPRLPQHAQRRRQVALPLDDAGL